MTAYYNEHDPFAAAWLRELIADNLIAPGEVDERSIEDVTPNELRPFRQCHFFAGIGVWSLAARKAGWDDDAPLWTGSCPCQPFSAAGKGGGFTDERHLWPAFHFLIEQCGPPVVAGEQVAGKNGDAWLDLVQSDLEATDYAFGAVETCACSFGAPHKRSRNYWMAHRIGARLERHGGYGDDGGEPGRIGSQQTGSVAARGNTERLGNDDCRQCQQQPGDRRSSGLFSAPHQSPRIIAGFGNSGASVGGVAHSDGRGCGGIAYGERRFNYRETPGRLESDGSAQHGGEVYRIGRPGPTNGFWRDADWLRCRDEKWRPVEPGTFPLADAGTFRNRVGLLRGAGNAITIGQAQGWLEAVMNTL